MCLVGDTPEFDAEISLVAAEPSVKGSSDSESEIEERIVSKFYMSDSEIESLSSTSSLDDVLSPPLKKMQRPRKRNPFSTTDIIDVEGKGNCLYGTIAHLEHGTEWEHPKHPDNL
jgi:hypothetical protein